MLIRTTAALPLVLAACLVVPALGQAPPSQVNVRDFGAAGDGKADDTAAFTKAMAAVAEHGGTVEVPVGNYLIKTHLDVPSNVTLEGIWKVPTAWTQYKGSTLLAVEGAGSETGTPFITLHSNSTLKGLTVFYPDQKADHITPYPWCVASGGGDDESIVDCLLVNPYQAVDFGTHASGRHYIRGLYGQPLKCGIYVDKCYDIGRIEDVHFWPFWQWDEKSGIRDWMWKNGEAFVFARTDWEYVFNTFVFGYHVGYHFTKAADGAMNGNLLGIGADASDIAVLVDEDQPYGLLITNGEFVSFAGEQPTEVVVRDTHTGAVQFQNCAFWGPAHQIAAIAGKGTVTFNNCNFFEWDRHNKAVPAIDLSGGNLIVTGCTFVKKSPQAIIEGGAQSAIFTSNRMAGPLAIANPAHAQVQIGLNIVGKPVAHARLEPGAIVADDVAGRASVRFTGDWRTAEDSGDYLGATHWAQKGDGHATAAFRLRVPVDGSYRVFAYVGPDPSHDHARNAPVTVIAADGAHGKRIDERESDGKWVPLGAYRFRRAKPAVVTFRNDADGNVLADAVKLVPAAKR